MSTSVQMNFRVGSRLPKPLLAAKKKDWEPKYVLAAATEESVKIVLWPKHVLVAILEFW